MVLLTKEELIDFAEQNGLYLHPTNPIDDHIARVNAGNGACPCDPNNRTCPCDEAITDSNDPNRPEKERCCTCRVLVSQDYLESWGYGGSGSKKKKGPKRVVEARPIIEEPPPGVSQEEFDSSMDIVKKAKHARDMIKKDPVQAAEYLVASSEESTCTTCEAYFIANALRCQVVGIMCSSGGEEDCDKAQKEASDGLTRMISLYEEVAGVKEAPAPSNNNDQRRECVSASLKSDDLGMAIDALGIQDPKSVRNIRFFISTKKCSKSPITIEEGIELAMTNHPEWFVGAKQ